MSEIVKKTSVDYHIDTGNNNVIVDTVEFILNGNLTVMGTSSTVESTNTYFADNVITLQAAPGGNPLLNAGIEVDRGASANVGLRFNEGTDHWEYTNDGTLWKWIWTEVYDDKTPVLGGNLDVGNCAIEPGTNGDIQIGPILKLPQLTTSAVDTLINAPVSTPSAPVANYSLVYAKPASSGQTGLFVTNQKTNDAELITKRKAFIYSIIF